MFNLAFIEILLFIVHALRLIPLDYVYNKLWYVNSTLVIFEYVLVKNIHLHICTNVCL